ncbi:MLP-like protein 43 [Vigna radiata var. radiata]|uniref:MLP-like protein 43 n=1 Tax=Vigna radiata var. radiata TaxID=3916 RepID=A0A3Q0EW51_VIGRR|nr:MLP-like protein 43 [Vigna radiata var. radiata]
MACCEVQKLETKVSMKASAEKFYDVLCNKTHQLPNISPQNLLSVQIHKGQWGTQGSIISWNYLHEGKVSVVKEILEDIDKEKKKISFRVIEGELLQHYKSFKIMIQVTPMEEGSTVHCVFEYQKQRHHIPDPHAIMQITLHINNTINVLFNYILGCISFRFSPKLTFKKIIQSVEIQNGKWGTEGSILTYNYILDGKICVAKKLVEVVERENNKVNMKIIEGDVLEHYKTFKSNLQVTPKENGSVVQWIIEFEKHQNNIPDPHILLQKAAEITKDIDSYLTKK